jgi:hypothetical protein
MPTRHRILPATLIPILLGLFTALALAQKDPRGEAKTHYTNGKALYEQGEYEKAIAEFKAADALAPSGVNDFNIGLAYEQLGQNAEAVRYLRSYLQRVPDAKNKATVEATIERLEAAMSSEEEARRAEEEARRIAAEQEARRIEAEKTGGGTTGGGTTGGGTTGGAAPAAATGDPELDRVAAVDVNQIRDQRAAAPVGGGGGAAEGGTGAVGPTPYGTGAGGPPPQPPPGGEPPKSKPAYKKWWFWVIVGVSAVVLYSIVTADSDEPQPLQGNLERMMPMPVQGAPAGGATLWRF